MLSRDGKKILRGVNLEIGDREIHSIIGANGAGKSTLAYTLMGLQGYEHEEGSLIFNGEDISKLSITERARKGITLAWQEPARFEGLRVRDYLAIGAKGSGGVTEEELKEALRKVDLKPEKYLDREVGEALSGGERKRIELASIITMKPKLAILDEPDSGIDVVSLKEIVNLIQTFKENGSSVLVITHRKEIAAASDKASLMCEGVILRSGDPLEISEFFKNRCIPCDSRVSPPKAA
ncbi:MULTISPECIES: ABC transporter ATP-binding protein [Methanosarcina]|uniref:ABC transporter ATP-binding protein n=1 Tax=Methanosarcina TaxID=2207 RepID=UPI001FE42C56|nr:MULTISPECIES: ABC transporter ATP-binding protein [Methanosarcina]MDW5551995.1 ABC transporter ATP-binding protein [Methanosarcina sp.]MDW5555757.1 ABC transporter ATP-binding protein [Methanosarcina sp.]MDW5561295.1 ABC transporter ATP-binding protein [Methanosarcina sp.]